ncbi:DUF4328 domain-containing protein [Kitasatospora sp. NPDC048365]|uniref:DUF4328 domain-containing protein n=1 Tax=Kitasatospora sp. NPDC048365 TaxID=3364050 RepID=UPI00371072FE
MSTEAVGDAPRQDVPVGEKPVVDPGSAAVAAQAVIAAYTVAQLAVGLAGGTRAGFFAAYVPVGLVLMVGSAVLFLRWFSRCRHNAQAFDPAGHRFGPGLAVGGWFIPLANLWIPYRVTLDIWRASGPRGGEWLLNAWWVAWLAKTLGAAVLMQTQAHPNGYSAFDRIAGVVAGVLAVLMIRTLTARQRARLAA